MLLAVMGVETACRLAEFHLADALPRRWQHARGVGSRAETVSTHVDDGALLVAAAWLHDIGYAPDLATYRFHPLDGARAIRDRGGDARLCGLVAFHSAAAHEATSLGLFDALTGEFSDESSTIRDLLWYFDMTTNPDGDTVSFGERMADVRARYSVDHYVIRALDESMSDRRAAVARAESWLAEAGLVGQV